VALDRERGAGDTNAAAGENTERRMRQVDFILGWCFQ
jgi:hypothetical protein